MSEFQYKITNSSFAQYPVLDKNILYFVSLDEDGMDIFSKKVSFDQQFVPPQEDNKEIHSCSNVELKEGNLKDFFLSLTPSVRSIYNPIFGGETNKWDMLLGGIDPTGRYAYNVGPIGYDTKKEKWYAESVGVSTQVLKPLRIGLTRDNNKEETGIGIAYPHFIERQEKGLSGLSFGSSFSFKKKEKDLTIWSDWDFTYPLLRTGICPSFVIPMGNRESQKSVGIDVSSFGQIFIPPNKEMGVMVRGYDFGTTTSASIMGYEEIKSNRFISISLWYSFPLGKIRKGLWNPNIYLGDNFGVLWCSILSSHDKPPCFSFGVEENIEGSSLFGMNNFIITPGIAITKEGKIMGYLGGRF
ncbi:hypothetical protein KKE26_06935 [bacterium]|nr:hypothetical protein [bacterium]